MAILAALQSAAIRLMGQRPTAFFGSTQKFETELSDLVNEVATDILKSAAWQRLTRVATLAGDGAKTEFALPDDYDRMVVDSKVQDPVAWGYRHITDINEFLFEKERGFTGAPGGWIIYGGSMQFAPAPTGSAVFPYISKNYAKDGETLALKSCFTKDTDTFLLPERLLTLGLIWRWRENKKLDFTGDQEAFMKAISECSGTDKGARSYSSRSRASVRGAHPAWPWALG